MIGRIVTGKSFSGVGKYVLHDKDHAHTSERVDWTHTHNVLSNDARKAFKEMAWTAKNSRAIKSEIGGSMAGRKSNGNDVLHSILSWHPEEKPTPEQMRAAGMDYLKAQGLEDHEAVFVAHNDEKHRHMHVISNLINPLTGKKHTQSMSQRKMQAWAHEYEKQNGKIYCQERANTQERLKKGEKNVRHRDPQNPHKKAIRQMYADSKSGQEFAARASAAGYQFGKGRRDFILMDENGKEYNVARYATDKTKGVRAKFADLENLPDIQKLKAEHEHRQTIERDERQAAERNATAEAERTHEAKIKEDSRTQKVDEAREKIRDRSQEESERQADFTRQATPEQDNEEQRLREEFRRMREKGREGGHDRSGRKYAPDIGY